MAASVIPLLDAFSVPRTIVEAARQFPRYDIRSFRKGVRLLTRLGFLVEPGRRDALDFMKVWRYSFPAIYYQCLSRDFRYATGLAAKKAIIEARLAEARQPPLFKDYPSRKATALPSERRESGRSLERALDERRTVRQFRKRAVPFEDFVAVIRRTWGQTGWVDAGPMGRLVLKSSPSAGARHPIECYVLAWNVDGLRPGLYHYGVRRNRLELLRPGDLRSEAVAIASGQSWIRGAAFLCVLTAVTERVFWKYQMADGYRLFFLDAGHLAQTFVLLATSRGLGPFTTAAIQEKKIERLLGIDGIREFPVYLCGAGLPSRSAAAATSASDPIPSSAPR